MVIVLSLSFFYFLFCFFYFIYFFLFLPSYSEAAKWQPYLLPQLSLSFLEYPLLLHNLMSFMVLPPSPVYTSQLSHLSMSLKSTAQLAGVTLPLRTPFTRRRRLLSPLTQLSGHQLWHIKYRWIAFSMLFSVVPSLSNETHQIFGALPMN